MSASRFVANIVDQAVIPVYHHGQEEIPVICGSIYRKEFQKIGDGLPVKEYLQAKFG
jgi:hypothetical protein